MGKGLINVVLDLSVPALVAFLVPACDLGLGIMTGRKTHLFLRGGGLFNLTHKGTTRASHCKLDKFNLEMRHGFLPARRIETTREGKRWSCHSLEFRQDLLPL